MILSAVCFSAVLVSVSLSKQCKHDLAVQVQCKCSAGALREQLEDNVPRLVGICHPPSCLYLVITSGHSIFFNSTNSWRRHNENENNYDSDPRNGDMLASRIWGSQGLRVARVSLSLSLSLSLNKWRQAGRVWGSRKCYVSSYLLAFPLSPPQPSSR